MHGTDENDEKKKKVATEQSADREEQCYRHPSAIAATKT
jgi:hypothetical protein